MNMALERDKNRTYLGTHPWINFRLDLRAATSRFWMMIGEARSKCQHIAGVPLRPEIAQKLYLVYLSKGVHATTSIEGNTLSEDQVRQQVEGRLKLPSSQQYLADEVANIVQACNEIGKEVRTDPIIGITPGRMRRFNALVLKDARLDDGAVPGEFRKHSVGVMGYRGAPWDDCPYLIDRLCDWLNGSDFDSDDPEIKFALTMCKAVLAHLYIAWIHPFGDGNGRTARLVEFQILVQSGVSYPAGHLLSNHYNKTRARYYAELDRSSKVDGGDIAFIDYAVQGFVDGLREQLDYIRDCQWRVTWENYVHDQFRDKDTPACSRQKHLILDMPDRPTPRKDLPSVSARVAREYLGRGEKTLTRDLNALAQMKLIRKVRKGFVPNRDLILAFLPPRCEDATERAETSLF